MQIGINIALAAASYVAFGSALRWTRREMLQHRLCRGLRAYLAASHQ